MTTSTLDVSSTPPHDTDAETASYGYLMSLVTVFVGLPIPIINLLASAGYFLAVRKSSPFVKFHGLQVLLSQFALFFVNSTGFWWTISIVLGSKTPDDRWIAYVITTAVFNLIEMVTSIRAMIVVRRRQHVEWWFFGPLAHVLGGTR